MHKYELSLNLMYGFHKIYTGYRIERHIAIFAGYVVLRKRSAINLLLELETHKEKHRTSFLTIMQT